MNNLMSYSETPIHQLLVSLTSICILLLFRLALTQFAGHICILFFKKGNKCVVCSCAFKRQFIVTTYYVDAVERYTPHVAVNFAGQIINSTVIVLKSYLSLNKCLHHSESCRWEEWTDLWTLSPVLLHLPHLHPQDVSALTAAFC